ncbi:MAG: O-methyltransferase, partial [Planctomycetota bacterium]
QTGTSMSVGEICRRAGMKPFWAFLQFRLVRALRPASCLELGTAVGISGAYQAAALELNGHGRLFTIEGAPKVASVAEENFRKLGLARVSVRVGRFRNVLADVLAECSPLDYAFIDGHHEEHATIRYFRQVLPCLQPKAVLLFHDISWSDGMRRAWRTTRSSKEVRCAVGLPNLGVCVVSQEQPGGRPAG